LRGLLLVTSKLVGISGGRYLFRNLLHVILEAGNPGVQLLYFEWTGLAFIFGLLILLLGWDGNMVVIVEGESA
jgi:hypothetical protein